MFKKFLFTFFVVSFLKSILIVTTAKTNYHDSSSYCSASKEPIQGLEPRQLWEHFYNISCVPRCSSKEAQVKKIILEDLARSRGYEYIVDKKGNALMKVPATPGKESKPVIALQTHLDIVCEKNEGTDHDFDKDPIQMVKEGEYIAADGTTLGADDGIGMAAVLTLLQDDTVVHGPLELLFTVEEEIGLLGALELQPGFIKAKQLINVDSFGEGKLTIGCAGGQTTKSSFPSKFEREQSGNQRYLFRILGGLGGHSGVDIDKKRANAIKLLAKFLLKLKNSQTPFSVSNIYAGDKDNAIPREANVVLSFNPRNEGNVKKVADEFLKEIKLVYGVSDPGLTYEMRRQQSTSLLLKEGFVLSSATVDTIVRVILVFPNGVVSFSSDFPGIVETSLNLASIVIATPSSSSSSSSVINDNSVFRVKLVSSIRSSLNSAKLDVAQKIKALFALVPESKVEVYGDYPAWVPIRDAELVKISEKVYKEIFGKDIKVELIHGGLETAIIGDIYPGIQMVSIGPDILGAHSPNEKVKISSVKPLYQYLVGLLYQLSK